MRHVVTLTDESHPDVPEYASFRELAEHESLVWQLYVDGVPFIGYPFTWTPGDTEHDLRAFAARDKILATGRHEYVDVRLGRERRTEERRLPADGPPLAHGRRSVGQDRRRSE
jgi:hypothetical protein